MQQKYKQYASSSIDGLTLFRFAHISKNANAGGVESYLEKLNYLLLEKNKMQILQMYLIPEGSVAKVEVEKVGKGEIVWIPSIERHNNKYKKNITQKIWTKIKRRFVPDILICHDILLSVLEVYNPKLAVFHWISEDSKIVADYLIKKRIPIVVINHFNNSRFDRRLVKQLVAKANAIAGVSSIDVPSYIKNRFTNLSDGIDTEFFQVRNADYNKIQIQKRIIFFPSRITEEKGHLDAVRALSYLAREGINVTLAFAGFIESAHFMEKLKRKITVEKLQDNIIFAGELNPVEMRNWYAAADVILLPSYTEGLGRVLLEAQAMEKPVVAYQVGGVSEAIKNNETGFLAKRGNAKELAKHLKVLLDNDKIRSEMGCKGKKHITSNFSLSALVSRHEKFYRQALCAKKT